MKANGPTLRAQSHLVSVYEGNPSLTGANLLYTCTFSFSKVKETIAANPNKVTAVTTSPSTTSNLTLGSTFSVTVTGDTGTIGAGSSPDADMMWMSPVARSSWPSRALRLESSVVKFANNTVGVDSCTQEGVCKFTNQLLIKNLLTKADAIQKNAKSLSYKATYTFRVVGKTTSAVPVLPISQISSGTQIKHTPIPATALNSIGTDQVTINATLSKSMSSTAVVTGSSMEFKYTLTLQNPSATDAITVDQISDSKDTSLSYKANSVSAATYPGATGGSATSVASIAPSTDSQGRLIFSGRYTVPANSRLELTYSMTSVCASGTFQYTNSATAQIGALTIGSSATTYTQVVASGTCGDQNFTSKVTDPVLSPEVVTLNANQIGQYSAVLNGTVDPNGNSGATIEFLWGKDSNLADQTPLLVGTTSNATTPYGVSATLNNISSGTHYYFRLRTTTVQNGVTTTQLGAILSFLTTEPVGSPTITTDAPTGVTSSTATLNGTLDPNQTSSQTSFKIGTSAATPSGTLSSGTLIAVRDDMSLPIDTTTANPVSTFSGSFATSVTATLNDTTSSPVKLAANTTYYYQAILYNTSGTQVGQGEVRSFRTTNYLAQTISFSQPTDKDYSVGSITVAPTATSGMQAALASDSPLICSVTGPSGSDFTITFKDVGACTLVATQDGGLKSGTADYYSAATAVVQTFTITRASRTLTINPDSFKTNYSDWGQAPPQITSTATVADTQGTKSYSIVGTGTVCSIDSATGQVSFLKPGTCTVGADISTGAQYNAATANTVSFSIGKKTQSLTFLGASVSLGSASTTLSASSNAIENASGLGTYLYSVDEANSTATCSVNGSSLSFTQVGVCKVLVSRSGNDYWTNATATATITVTSKLTRALALKMQSPGGNVTLPASVTDWTAQAITVVGEPNHNDVGDKYTYSLDAASVGREVNASTGELTFTGAGTCLVRSQVSEGPNYNSALSSVATITIGKRTQLITNIQNGTLSAPSGHSTLDASSNATTANAGISAATYAIDPASTEGCTMVGTDLYFTKAGSCVINVHRNENDNWTDANKQVIFTIERAVRTLTIDPSSYATAVADWSQEGSTLSAVADHDNGDGTKTFALAVGSSGCSLDAATGHVTFTGAGTCLISSHITQGDRYNAADSAHISITIGKRAQTLAFDDAAVSVQNSPFSLSASTTSVDLIAGLAQFTYEIAPGLGSSDGCAVSADGTLTFTQQGDCYVKVTGSGNDHWLGATKIAHFTINGKKTRTLRIKPVSEAAGSYNPAGYSDWNSNAPTLTPDVSVSDSGDTYTYSLENDSVGCSVDSNSGKVSFNGAGICKIHAHGSEGAQYNSAQSETISFTIGKRNQEITNFADTEVTVISNSLALSAGSSADTNTGDFTEISYSIDQASSSDCAVVSGSLTFDTVGDCVLTATRNESAHWKSAQKTIRINIVRADRKIDFDTGSYVITRSYSDWSVSAPHLDGIPSAGNTDGTLSYGLESDSTGCTIDQTTGVTSFTGPGLAA